MRKVNKKELIRIFNLLKKEYGIDIKKIDFLKDFDFYINREGKIFILNKNNLKLENVARFGLYILKIEKNGIRFSIEGAQLFGKYANKRILEIEPEKVFYYKSNLERVDVEDGYYVMKYKENFLGSCYVKSKELKDFIPKDRKIIL